MMLDELVPCGNPKIISTIDHRQRSISKDWLKAIRRKGVLYCAWCNKKKLPTGRKKYCSDKCADSSSIYCSPQTHANAFKILMVRQDYKCSHCAHDYYPAFLIGWKQRLKGKRREIRRRLDVLKKHIPESRKAWADLEKSGKPNIEERGFNEKGHFYVKYPLMETEEINEWSREEEKKLNQSLKEYFEMKSNGPRWDFGTPDAIRGYHRGLKDNKEPEIDHIIPVALNGMAIGLDNAQILCYSCHKVKTRFDMVEIRNARKAVS